MPDVRDGKQDETGRVRERGIKKTHECGNEPERLVPVFYWRKA